MTPSIVCFKWRPPPGYALRFASADVNRLYERMLKHYPAMRRFICITDEPIGLDPRIEIEPIGKLFSNLRNPTWQRGPACHRRLIAFSPVFEKIAGPRFACIDIDVKPVGDLTPVFERPEDFVGWRSGRAGSRPQEQFGGALLMMTAGARAQVWERFVKDPQKAIAEAHAAGYHGSDQAWISYVLDKDGEAYWTEKDGVYYYRKLVPKAHVIAKMRQGAPPTRPHYRGKVITARHARLNYDVPNIVLRPDNARLVIFSHGLHEDSAATKIMSPWLAEE